LAALALKAGGDQAARVALEILGFAEEYANPKSSKAANQPRLFAVLAAWAEALRPALPRLLALAGTLSAAYAGARDTVGHFWERLFADARAAQVILVALLEIPLESHVLLFFYRHCPFRAEVLAHLQGLLAGSLDAYFRDTAVAALFTVLTAGDNWDVHSAVITAFALQLASTRVRLKIPAVAFADALSAVRVLVDGVGADVQAASLAVLLALLKDARLFTAFSVLIRALRGFPSGARPLLWQARAAVAANAGTERDVFQSIKEALVLGDVLGLQMVVRMLETDGPIGGDQRANCVDLFGFLVMSPEVKPGIAVALAAMLEKKLGQQVNRNPGVAFQPVAEQLATVAERMAPGMKDL
jgi:hypothetical protein